MAVSKKHTTKKTTLIKIMLGISLIVLGIVLNNYNIGGEDFFGYGSVGGYLIYVGILICILAIIMSYRNKNKIVDERMEKIAYKAMWITFLFIIILSFCIMIIDGINPINMKYSQFMSYFVCLIILFYAISYKILERKY
ncbi:MAG: DUF2178 domain-containing protein [Candidatus Nanoarchaeia archaeon]